MSRPDLERTRRPGLGRRLAAIIYDTFLVVGLIIVAFSLVYLPIAWFLGWQDLHQYPIYRHLLFIWIIMVGMGFHLWFWTQHGQTLGMQAWRLKLVSQNGSVSWRQALIRYGVALLSWLFFGLGFLWALFEKDKLTWHDLASGTYLVLVKKGENTS